MIEKHLPMGSIENELKELGKVKTMTTVIEYEKDGVADTLKVIQKAEWTPAEVEVREQDPELVEPEVKDEGKRLNTDFNVE